MASLNDCLGSANQQHAGVDITYWKRGVFDKVYYPKPTQKLVKSYDAGLHFFISVRFEAILLWFFETTNRFSKTRVSFIKILTQFLFHSVILRSVPNFHPPNFALYL